MWRVTILNTLFSLLVPCLVSAAQDHAVRGSDDTSPGGSISRMSASMPMAFTENQGQWDEQVSFRADAGGATMWFTKSGAYYQFTRRIPRDTAASSNHQSALGAGRYDPRYMSRTGNLQEESDSVETLMLKASFVGANPSPNITGDDMLEYKCNYFKGNDPNRWRTDVPNYRAVVYEEVYSGIDLKYYGNGRQMEYDFIVSPGADPAQINIRYEGAESISTNSDGELVIETKWGEVVEQRPVVYQLQGNSRVPLEGSYRLLADNTFGFSLSKEYDPQLPLVIDPVLTYSTYLGGSGSDSNEDIAVNPSGEMFFTGYTYSADFPTTDLSYRTSSSGRAEAYISKIASNRTDLAYSTYIGGSDDDLGYGIALHPTGAVYVTGVTWSQDFPTVNPLKDVLEEGQADAFIVQLSSSGNELSFSTYFGGSRLDAGHDIVADTMGALYVLGVTFSPDYPTLDPYQPVFGGGEYDSFIAKFGTSPPELYFSTYLGGSGWDLAVRLDVDEVGVVTVAGYTVSLDFPTLNPFQTFQGWVDGFVTRLGSSGDHLIYSTLLGGVGWDACVGLCVDNAGAVVVTGVTSSIDFPTTGAIQNELGGPGDDAFVAKIGSSGSSLLYSTYLGGTGDDYGASVCEDDYGAVYVVGGTSSRDFPMANPIQGSFQGGGYDGFVTKVSPAGTELVCSTFLGAEGQDNCTDLVVGAAGSILVVGQTESESFPLVNPFQATNAGGREVFVVEISSGDPCCHGRVGDANTMEGDEPTIGDVALLIDALYIGLDVGVLECLAEADINQSGWLTPASEDVSLGDIAILVDYLFVTGPLLGLPGCL